MGHTLRAHGAAPDSREETPKFLIAAGERIGHVQAADHDLQDVIEVMCDTAGDPAHYLHLLRTMKHRNRSLHILVGRFACRYVVDYGGKVSLPAGMPFGNRKIESEDRAILALTRYLAASPNDLCLAGSSEVGDIPVMLATVRLRHEATDVVTDDLVSGIAKDHLGGAVERLNYGALVDHHDAIDRRLDDCPVLCLLAQQSLFDKLALTDVARDVGIADELSSVVPYRLNDEARPEG